MGDTANLDSDATDADGDTLTYSATGLPTGASIAPATGVISGTLDRAATYSVTVTVSDGSLDGHGHVHLDGLAARQHRRRSSTRSRSRRRAR